MLLLKAIRSKNIFILWLGQVTSSIGDEVYRVAFTWFAVSMIGSETSYLIGLQFAALLAVTLFGGRWADQWNPYQTLIRSDLFRGFLVLLPVGVALCSHLSLPLLCATSVLIMGTTGFFEPALQSILPDHCESPLVLQAANGLMSTTIRMARITAPLVISALSLLIKPLHFFTLDAITFFISALSIVLLNRLPKKSHPIRHAQESQGVFESLTSTILLLKKKPYLLEALLCKSLGVGAWWVGYSVGLALIIKEKFNGNLNAYGLAMGAYGAGNIFSAIYFGNRVRVRHELQIYSGATLLGVGFLTIAAAPTLTVFLIATALTATMGPFNDLPLIDLIQKECDLKDLRRVFRFRLALETSVSLVGFLIAPFLFKTFSVTGGMCFCAAWIMGLALFGFIHHWKRLTRS